MRDKVRGSVLVGVLVLSALLATATTANADGPYFPPNPAPQYVEPGLVQFAYFPVPGLYLGITSPGQPPNPEAEIKVTVDGLPPTSDPVVEPPKTDGSLDATLGAAVKDKDPSNPFIGVATFHIRLCVYNPAGHVLVGCHTYDLLLYVGVPIPDTGADSMSLAAAGAAALLLGGGLIAISHRRRSVPIRFR